MLGVVCLDLAEKDFLLVCVVLCGKAPLSHLCRSSKNMGLVGCVRRYPTFWLGSRQPEEAAEDVLGCLSAAVHLTGLS